MGFNQGERARSQIKQIIRIRKRESGQSRIKKNRSESVNANSYQVS